jgi:hypothetical protein
MARRMRRKRCSGVARNDGNLVLPSSAMAAPAMRSNRAPEAATTRVFFVEKVDTGSGGFIGRVGMQEGFESGTDLRG